MSGCKIAIFIASSNEATMPDDSKDLEPITKLSLSSLGDCDVALMNLRAARGLKGTESLDEDALLAKLDEWVSKCKFEIWRHLYRIERQISQPPTEFSYGNSFGATLLLVHVASSPRGLRRRRSPRPKIQSGLLQSGKRLHSRYPERRRQRGNLHLDAGGLRGDRPASRSSRSSRPDARSFVLSLGQFDWNID